MSAAYRVFGLNVRSAVELPELVPSDELAHADVTITVERIDAAISAPGLHAVDGDLVFVAEGVARYRISEGSRIVVDPLPGSPEPNVRLFLLGSAFGALLHQRGLLPLHANAVEIGGKAVAFMGESGAGKSTLAAWFHNNGYRVLADDVTVVRFSSDGFAFAASGLPRVRLTREALSFLDRDPRQFQLSYLSDDSEKYDVPLGPIEERRSETPLAGIYLLDRGGPLEIERLATIDAAEVVFANTYRGSYVVAAGSQRDHWESCIRLIRSVPVYRLARTWGLAAFNDEMAAFLEHISDDCGA
jgi:hypothetical protein